MQLIDLVKNMPIVEIRGELDINICSLHYDSRQMNPDSLFFCIEGLKTDGHNFAFDAAEKGAVAIVLNRDIELPDNVTKIFVKNTRHAMALFSSRFYNEPSTKMALFGVTGTNGKTSVTYLLKSIMEQAGIKTGLIGTIMSLIGEKRIYTDRTTPESLDLHGLLNDMYLDDVKNVVMEVSSHSLALGRVAGCRFKTGIFTNITRDHLDFHGTFDNYLNAKTLLFGMCENSVINVDDECANKVQSAASGNIITYGIKNEAHIFANDIVVSSKGVSFRLFTPTDNCDIFLKIPGIFSVYNALAAAGAAFSIGISIEHIKDGLENIDGVPGRFELLTTGTDYSVILDYAHTPDGLENILKTAKNFASGKIITLFGCGGDRDPGKRPVMGEIAGKYSDFCVVTSDNPRTEKPLTIIEGILPGIKLTQCPYIVVENRREAIRYALSVAKADDIIILAGKGHETYQILNDGIIRFDEKEIVKQIIEEMV